MSEHEIDLAGLRAAAEAVLDLREYDRGVAKMGRRTEKGCYIAAASPNVMLALIERLEAAEAAMAVSRGPRSAARVEGGSECHCGAAGAGEGGAL